MNELNAALYTKLQSTSGVTGLLSGTTAIYSMQAPDNAALPFIVFNTQGGGDENDTAHRTKNLVIFVRAYSKVSEAQSGSIDSAVDAALHLSSLNVSGWSNFWLAREEDLSAVEIPTSGQKIWMNGGLFRVRIEKT